MLCPGGSAASGSGGAQTLGLGRSGQLRRSARSASPEQLQAQGGAKQKRRHAEEVGREALRGRPGSSSAQRLCAAGEEAAGWALRGADSCSVSPVNLCRAREAQGQFRSDL